MLQALLLAETEPVTRVFLERHLVSDYFSVLGADAGREALELAERERPDLVLVGGLPDAPALEVCRLVGPQCAGDRARRGALVGPGRPRPRLSARLRRLRAAAVPLRGARGADPRGAQADAAGATRTAPRPAAGRRPRDPARDGPRPGRRPRREGVRAAAEARRPADARVHEGRAAA